MTKKNIVFLCSLTLMILAGCTAPQSSDDADTDTDITKDISNIENESTGDTASNSDESSDQEVDDFGDDEMADQAEPEAQSEDAVAAEDSEPVPEPLEEQPTEEVAQKEPEQVEEFSGEPEQIEEPKKQELSAFSGGVDNKVTEINYLDNKNGGAVEIKTTGPATYFVRPSTNMNQYVVEIQDATLSGSLKRPYIMKDFSGAFGTINAYQNPGGKTARIVVQMKGAGEPIITQEGNTLIMTAPGFGESMPVIAQKESPTLSADKDAYDTVAAAKSEKILGARTLDDFLTGHGQYFGFPISIQTNNADVREVIGFIAEQSGVNLVISDDVSGKVSVKLRQVPWDQALVIIMKAKGLGYVRQGNILRITKLETLQDEAVAAKKIVDSQKVLEPLKVKVIPVSYAVVESLEKQVEPFLTNGRGKAVSDARTSSLIITDTAEILMKIEQLVKQLDIPPAQVMIEGKIVEASETFTRRLGVNWSLSGSPVQISAAGGRAGSPVSLSQSLSVSNFTSSEGANGIFGLHIGSLDLMGSLDATLKLAQAENMVRIISSPRVVTMNKEKAEISQKGEIITIQSTKDNLGNITAASKAFPLELNLTVTPQITADGSVVLDMSLLRQFPGAEADRVTKAKPINTRSAKTKVLVPNGQTAVIGGIYQSDETESEEGVPGLKDIPVLGWLFKSKTQERVKTELLLFLTPRILNAKDQSVTN